MTTTKESTTAAPCRPGQAGPGQQKWLQKPTITILVGLIFACLAVLASSTAGYRQSLISESQVGQEASHHRTYFYAGGHYAENGRDGHVFAFAMYVERLVPAEGTSQAYPLVFIHGQGLNGANWLNKPDGGPGWASFFLRQGYEVYLIDQTFRGRSPASPDTALSAFSAETVQQKQTAPGLYNLWPQASLHTQWNGTGVMGDPVFDAYYSSGTQFLTPGARRQQETVQQAGAALLDRIGRPVILVGHSQGGIMPWLIADARPGLTHAIVALEPSGPPFRDAIFSTTPARLYGLTDAALTYDPPVLDPETDFARQTSLSASALVADCTLQAADDWGGDDRREPQGPRQLVHLRDINVAVVTAPASFHAQYDWCTVAYLRQAGVNTTHVLLSEHGIEGNGHMMFLEKNSDEIARLVLSVMQQL